MINAQALSPPPVAGWNWAACNSAENQIVAHGRNRRFSLNALSRWETSDGGSHAGAPPAIRALRIRSAELHGPHPRGDQAPRQVALGRSRYILRRRQLAL